MSNDKQVLEDAESSEMVDLILMLRRNIAASRGRYCQMLWTGRERAYPLGAC
jgi:hypothetical protein